MVLIWALILCLEIFWRNLSSLGSIFFRKYPLPFTQPPSLPAGGMFSGGWQIYCFTGAAVLCMLQLIRIQVSPFHSAPHPYRRQNCFQGRGGGGGRFTVTPVLLFCACSSLEFRDLSLSLSPTPPPPHPYSRDVFRGGGGGGGGVADLPLHRCCCFVHAPH